MDLPAPLGPRKPKTLPSGTVRVTPFSASVRPKCLTTSEHVMAHSMLTGYQFSGSDGGVNATEGSGQPQFHGGVPLWRALL